MGMLAKLLGVCAKVRFEGLTVDGDAFSGKSTIECFNYNKEELEQYLKDAIFVETGKRVLSLKIVAFIER